jgi:hypothetical protein
VSTPPCPLSVPVSVHGGSSTPDWSMETFTRSTDLSVGKKFPAENSPAFLQRGPWTFVKSTRYPDFADFTLRPLEFSEINPRSTNFLVRSEIQKIFTKRSLASGKSTKIAPKIRIFSTTTPNPVILVPKFLESLPLSFYAFISHMFVALYGLIACIYFTVGNVVPELFFEDFQDQAFEETPFFIAEEQVKCP